MNCPNCNQPVADGRKFCTHCGCPADAPYFFDANALGTGLTDVLTKKYFCFRGRARRKEYWTFILFIWIIGFVLLNLTRFTASAFGMSVFFVYLCGVGIPTAALTVRRFHDTGRPSWWALLLLVLGVFLPSVLKLISLIPLSVIACFDSQPGPNEYGQNPKGQ